MKHVIVIIDLGTTNIKATIMGKTGETVSVKTLSTPVSYGKNSMEINPEALWTTVLDCCRGAIYSVGEELHVDGVVCSSMAASFIPLDRAGHILGNAIGWSDSRCSHYTDLYMKQFLAGNRIPNCGQYPLPMYAGFKLQWLKESRPEVYHQIGHWLNVSEFIYSRLLGADTYVTDYSIASRTMLFDVGRRTWNPDALSYFNIDPNWLPTPHPAGTVVGLAGPQACEAGFSPDTKIILGGHDHMCAIAGAGITKPGIILNSTGTSEAVEALIPSAQDPECLAGRWMNLESSVIPGAVAAVCYVGASGHVYRSGCDCLREYDSSTFPMPDSEPIFLPPHRAQLPSVKGQLLGIDPIFTAQQITRALRDGMYYECRRDIQRILGGEISENTVLRCVGGHTKNRYEMQLKSDALGCVIETVRKEDIASKGAFILASVSCGWNASIPETAEQLYAKMEKERYIPDPERKKRYDEIYREHYFPQFPEGLNSI